MQVCNYMSIYCLLCARHWEPRDKPREEKGQKSTIHGVSSQNKFIFMSYYLLKFNQWAKVSLNGSSESVKPFLMTIKPYVQCNNENLIRM